MKEFIINEIKKIKDDLIYCRDIESFFMLNQVVENAFSNIDYDVSIKICKNITRYKSDYIFNKAVGKEWMELAGKRLLYFQNNLFLSFIVYSSSDTNCLINKYNKLRNKANGK